MAVQKYHTAHGGDVAARKGQYADMVNKYYDLATSFYEYGEGPSRVCGFHMQWILQLHHPPVEGAPIIATQQRCCIGLQHWPCHAEYLTMLCVQPLPVFMYHCSSMHHKHLVTLCLQAGAHPSTLHTA